MCIQGAQSITTATSMHDLELYYREELINYVVRIVQNSATVCLICKNNKKLQQANATATVYAYVANESTLN